jgi:PAS domain S-box-containing protein
MKSSGDLSSELILSEERYRRLFETAQDGILLLDARTGLIMDANPFISKLTGYSEKELLNKHIWDLGFLKNIAANKSKFLELQEKGYARYENLPLETKSGEIHSVEFISNSYLVGDDNVIQCNIRDISSRIKVEKLNSELNMMYKVILLCNQILLHETTINTLIEQMCKILVSNGGFQACWVSHAISESANLIKPIAAEGVEDSYFKKLNKAIENNLNQGLVATAIRLNNLLICQDLKNEEQESIDREYALKKGYSSVAVIPISSLKKVPYVLVVYGHNPQDLSGDIIALLKNLAGDIAFGIDNLDAQAAYLNLVDQVHST